MSVILPPTKDPITRRNILSVIGLLSLLPILKLGGLDKKKNVMSCAPTSNKNTSTYLTQDGKLVEVDISKINSNKEKISNQQLQSWIKKEL